MSTIDINSVAGFKAVDAEGNELGIMSMADITAAVKESIMQDAAMARSVATLSEASTLAASDTYEDELDIKTDLTWARGLDANGNPILISKQSLASVVGGLNGVSGMKIRSYYVEKNTTVDTGINNKGLIVIGNDDYFSGNISAFINNHADKEAHYLGENNTPHLKVFKEINNGNIKITNTNNEYNMNVFMRIYPL